MTITERLKLVWTIATTDVNTLEIENFYQKHVKAPHSWTEFLPFIVYSYEYRAHELAFRRIMVGSLLLVFFAWFTYRQSLPDPANPRVWCSQYTNECEFRHTPELGLVFCRLDPLDPLVNPRIVQYSNSIKTLDTTVERCGANLTDVKISKTVKVVAKGVREPMLLDYFHSQCLQLFFMYHSDSFIPPNCFIA